MRFRKAAGRFFCTPYNFTKRIIYRTWGWVESFEPIKTLMVGILGTPLRRINGSLCVAPVFWHIFCNRKTKFPFLKHAISGSMCVFVVDGFSGELEVLFFFGGGAKNMQIDSKMDWVCQVARRPSSMQKTGLQRFLGIYHRNNTEPWCFRMPDFKLTCEQIIKLN